LDPGKRDLWTVKKKGEEGYATYSSYKHRVGSGQIRRQKAMETMKRVAGFGTVEDDLKNKIYESELFLLRLKEGLWNQFPGNLRLAISILSFHLQAQGLYQRC
jgi:hypothetical protein